MTNSILRQAELIAAYENVKDRINERVPALFEVFPKADYEVKQWKHLELPQHLEQVINHQRLTVAAGIFYINSYSLKSQLTLL